MYGHLIKINEIKKHYIFSIVFFFEK